MSLEMLHLSLNLLLVFVHVDSKISLSDQFVKLLLIKASDIVFLEVKDFTVIFTFILDSADEVDSIDIFERINVYDVLASFLFLGLVKSFSFFLSFAIFDEVQDLSPSDVWEKSLELFLLLTNALIIAIFSLKIL